MVLLEWGASRLATDRLQMRLTWIWTAFALLAIGLPLFILAALIFRKSWL